MGDARSLRARSTLAALILVVAARAGAADATEAIARGDAGWERRADGAQGGRAAKGPIGASVAAYEEALKADPGNLEATWKLLRAIWFQGEYSTANNDERQKVFARGKEVSEAAWVRVGKRVGAQKLASEKASDRAAALRGMPEAPPLLLFSAANWGLWADAYGKLAAARQGVAGKVRDWAETLIVLDERYDDGAGHRVLGRVHTEAPHIPFVTGWVDHDKGLAELEKSVVLGPDEPGNRYYLARAILSFRPEKKSRALALLREVAAGKPRPDFPVEDAKSAAQAAELLAKNGR
jgi:tetratricopeptide (TPR) repeat protein